jgi:hypothetical protein
MGFLEYQTLFADARSYGRDFYHFRICQMIPDRVQTNIEITTQKRVLVLLLERWNL